MCVREEGNKGKCTGRGKVGSRCGDGRNMTACHLSQSSPLHINEILSYNRR